MSRSERVYRVLLLAYPREFRRDCGTEMVQVFGDLCREEMRRGGALGLVRVWARTLLDLVATAFAERSSGMRERWLFMLVPLARDSLRRFEPGVGRHRRLRGGCFGHERSFRSALSGQALVVGTGSGDLDPRVRHR